MTVIPKFFFVLKCPGCGHEMKYHSQTRTVSSRRKRCVYCGRSFKVGEHVIREL